MPFVDRKEDKKGSLASSGKRRKGREESVWYTLLNSTFNEVCKRKELQLMNNWKFEDVCDVCRREKEVGQTRGDFMLLWVCCLKMALAKLCGAVEGQK